MSDISGALSYSTNLYGLCLPISILTRERPIPFQLFEQ